MENNSQPKRQRARKGDGKFKGDDPKTPDLNEAWVPTEVSAALPKTKDYTIKKKVDGPSANSAGPYSKKPKIRPTFGNVTTTSA